MRSSWLNFDQSLSKKLAFWRGGFDKIFGTNKNWGKWSNMVTVLLPDIASRKIKFENVL